jgi:hypothetical protein
MKRPFLLVQLSDPHVGADWGDGDPVAMLAAAVECVRALEPNPDGVLISGDLADHALDVEYEQVRQLLAPLQAPLSVLPGNHDDRLHCAATSAVPVTAVIPCSEVGLPPADRRRSQRRSRATRKCGGSSLGTRTGRSRRSSGGEASSPSRVHTFRRCSTSA